MIIWYSLPKKNRPRLDIKELGYKPKLKYKPKQRDIIEELSTVDGNAYLGSDKYCSHKY